MTLSCVSSWAQSAIDERNGPRGWSSATRSGASCGSPRWVAKVDADLRLSRAKGTIQVLATHELADFKAVGNADSAEVAIAESLINKCAIRVLRQQAVKPLRALKDIIGLTDTEVEEIGRWSGAGFLGWGLWQCGTAGSHVVRVDLTATERRLFHTNERMTV